MYNVVLAEPVMEYLTAIPPEEISPEGIISLIDQFSVELGERADDFHQQDPLGPESLLFNYETILVSVGSLHLFRLIVNMDQAEYGIVVVIYIDRMRLHPP
ncbi:MAG TPA: hypothetical protein VG097_13880 [Gemmata sp.]|nr:hypothetical protein [Gemmata sp.]